jgi:pyruvate dehydrogenase phosphatase regulatory subunit
MVCPTQQQTRIMDWMQTHLEGFKSVSLQDVTSMYTVLTLVGPKAKDLMQEMCETEMTMPPFTFRFFNMSYASGVQSLAVTQTGEPGYSLYVPTESALHLYDKLMRVGINYGIRNVGQLAMRFLRIERFIPFWGDELNADTNPIETNRIGKVMFDKGDFIGRDALLQIKDQGVTKRLAQFHLMNFDKDKDLWPGGGEALYRNGDYVG